MTIELVVSDEMAIAMDNLDGLAGKLLETSRLTDVSIRMKWSQKRKEQEQQEPRERARSSLAALCS